MADFQQQYLELGLPEPLSVIRLTALSPRKAYYVIEVIHITGAGYIIRKSSGAAGAKPVVETWYRPSYSQAMSKQHCLIKGKLCKKKGRLYQIQSISNSALNDHERAIPWLPPYLVEPTVVHPVYQPDL
jgi:hypothetical protein